MAPGGGFSGWSALSGLSDLAFRQLSRGAYGEASRLLADLVIEAHRGLTVDRLRGLRAVAAVCLQASGMSADKGDAAVAWIAADRAERAAMELGDARLIGNVEVLRAHVAMRHSLPGRTRGVTAAYLASAAETEETVEARGAAHVQAALVMSATDGASARAHLAEAREFASHGAQDGILVGIEFNETITSLAAMRCAIDERDFDLASSIAREINPDRFTLGAYQCAYLLDLARVQLELGRHGRALRLAELAASAGGDRFATDPAARLVLHSLTVEGVTRGELPRLKALLRRIGAASSSLE